jgi:DNA-directed RNA polymerase subunit beta
VLLKALGYTPEDLLRFYYDTETVFLEKGGKYSKSIEFEILPGQRATRDIKVGEEVIVRKARKFTRAAIRKLRDAGMERLPLDTSEVVGKVSAEKVIDEDTGELLLQTNEEVTEEKLEKLREAKIQSFKVLFIDGLNVGSYLRDTLLSDKIQSQDEAILEIYRRLRPGDPPTLETARTLFQNLFFNPERYALSKVGRLKLNYKFYKDEDPARPPLEASVLTTLDILHTVKHLIELKNGRGSVDDIDHLGNRRVRAVGELMENQYRIGLVRMERAIKERMSMSQEIETLMPHDLINAKPVSAVVKEYFGSSQLSQFMDQTNPLSEVTHKRRLSALGPGGLTRERAGFEVRDVHPTHYGRICPIETPEGPNIGLIASLSTFARVNEYGFVETPYRRVVDGVVSNEIKWFSALEEEGHYIAQANAPRDKNNALLSGFVPARYNGESVMVQKEQITLMEVSSNQLVSVAASLIPFLEHDDANRALMGSNMQRQAVPLLRSDSPIVGTGLELRVARDSGVCILAKRDGVVESVDATREVPALEPEHVVHTEAGRAPRREGQGRRRHRRRPELRHGRAGARPQRRRRLHAVGRLQLRGLDPHLGAHCEGGHLYLRAHRGVRVRRARHQARQGRDHARHPQRRRGGPQGPRRLGHRAHRRRGEERGHPRRQDHAEGGDAAQPRGEAPPGHLRREGG